MGGNMIQIVSHCEEFEGRMLMGYVETVTTALWWSMLQVGLAIIAASLPTIYALRKHVKVGSKSLRRVEC